MQVGLNKGDIDLKLTLLTTPPPSTCLRDVGCFLIPLRVGMNISMMD